VLKTFVLVGTQRTPPEEAAGTSGGSRELLVAGSGYQDFIATDLVDDPLLIDNNIENFKKAYDFAMVRPKYFPAGKHCRAAYLNLPPYAECDHPLLEKIRKAENRCEWSLRCPGKVHRR
jgi:hypothetical protein